MDKEEKELQIKLAKLNAKLQVDLASTFGLFGASAAFAAIGYQFLMDNWDMPIVAPKKIFSIFLLHFSVFCSYAALECNQKKKADIAEFENLRI